MLHHFKLDVDPTEVVAHLRRHGYAIVDNLVPDELMDQIGQELDPFIAATPTGNDEFDGSQTRRTGALVARSPASRDLVMHPMAVAVAKGFLSHASAVQLHLTQVITCAPGETRQRMHRDQMAFDLYPFSSDYHVQCNTIWALSDFSLENGATHIKPGSSAVSDEEAEAIPEFQAEMPRGSVLFYEGKVVHAGGANRTDSLRQAINIAYAVGWVRQEENQYISVPPEIARDLDDDLLKMLGYQEGAYLQKTR